MRRKCVQGSNDVQGDVVVVVVVVMVVVVVVVMVVVVRLFCI